MYMSNYVYVDVNVVYVCVEHVSADAAFESLAVSASGSKHLLSVMLL